MSEKDTDCSEKTSKSIGARLAVQKYLIHCNSLQSITVNAMHIAMRHLYRNAEFRQPLKFIVINCNGNALQPSPGPKVL